VLDDGLIYGSYATSSEPPAQITTLGLANAAFDLTEGKQFEIGWKQSFARGDLTVAAYDLRRTNILSRDPMDPNRLIQIGEQAGTGIEIGGRWQLAERWSIEGNASILDARFVRFDERVGAQVISRRGNQPTGVPEEVATLWLKWDPSANIEASIGTRAVGRRAANTANTVWLPGYATINATLSWSTDYGRFGARVRNLGDRVYATGGYNAANQALIGEPRWYELVWQHRFF
jgi:iron complex outermembrane receptor protein